MCVRVRVSACLHPFYKCPLSPRTLTNQDAEVEYKPKRGLESPLPSIHRHTQRGKEEFQFLGMLQFDSSQDTYSEMYSRGVCQEGGPGRMAITAASVSYLLAPPHAHRSEVWSLGLVSLDVDVRLRALLPFPAAEPLLCPLVVQACLLIPFTERSLVELIL